MRLEDGFDAASLLPHWVAKEKHLAQMLPYVSLVDGQTVRTRGNELFQCIRLDGINSYTKDDDELDKVRDLFAQIVSDSGHQFAYYVHKVSKPIDPTMKPIEGDSFAAAVDEQWRDFLENAGMRDKTLTLTIMHRPTTAKKVPFSPKKSIEVLREETAKRMRALREAVGFISTTFVDMQPRLLNAESGELLGFLGSLNTGEETPLYPGTKYGVVADAVANTRVTFKGDSFELTGGSVGKKIGTTLAIKDYSERTPCTMFDELNLPIDMVITHSFTPVNSNTMDDRIKRQMRLMQTTDDGAVTQYEQLAAARDELLSGRLSFGDHHMSVTLFANSVPELDDFTAEIRSSALTQGMKIIKEGFALRTHYFAQHPGNSVKRSRKAIVTSKNFASFAAFHRTPLGKTGDNVPWGVPITMLPTPERSGFWFNYHEKGSPDAEPTGGHTLIFGRQGAGKSVLSAFLATLARRAGARVFVFDYRLGMEMAVRANGGTYSSIKAGEPTGLNPLWTETDVEGQAWMNEWLMSLFSRDDKSYTPLQRTKIQEVIRQNAEAADPSLRNWDDLASLFAATDDDGDLQQRAREWAADGRYGWIFGQNLEDSFSLDGDFVGFDLTGILDDSSERERMAVLSYLFRRVERTMKDLKPTLIIVDETWKSLDNHYFREKLESWLFSVRKQNAVVVMMTQFPSQLKKTGVAETILQAVPTQILLPNSKAKAADYDLLSLEDKELDVMLTTPSASRLGLVRDDQGSVVVNADLSALGPLLTILGGMKKGEQLVGADYRQRPDFWRVK